MRIIILPFIAFLLFMLPPSIISAAEEPQQDIDWRIRLLIVTGKNVEDGHRRLYRTARGVNIPTQIISVENKDEEISQILDAIGKGTYPPTDVVVVINSNQYIVGQEPAFASFKVILETMKQGASVILSYPMAPKPENPELQKMIKDLEKKLDAYKESKNGAVKPYSKEEASKAHSYLAQLAKLDVEERQIIRDSQLYLNTKDFTAYALGGLVSSVVEFLEKMREEEKIGSVSGLWHASVDSLTLREKYNVAIDDNFHVFQNGRAINTDTYSYKKGHGGTIVFHAAGVLPVSPFLYAGSSQVPFIPANMMAKEVGYKESCPDCLDEPLPIGTPLPVSDVPYVQLIVLLEHETPFVRLFFQCLQKLDYPKDSLYLTVYVGPAAEKDLKEVKEYLQEGYKEYELVALLEHSEDLNDGKARNFLLKKATELQPDYVLLLEANAHLTKPDILQELMNKKRNIVGPLLQSSTKNQINIKTVYSNGKFDQGPHLGNYISENDDQDSKFSFIGLLQVPQITGAVLLSREAYPSLMLHYEKSNDSLWDTFYGQVLRQGFIPYVSNEANYGYLIDESRSTAADLWNLDLNVEAFLDFYSSPSDETKIKDAIAISISKDQVSSGQECTRVEKAKIFNSYFVQDMLENAETAQWNVSPRLEDGIEMLSPAEEIGSLENIYAQSIIRYLVSDKNLRIPNDGGKFKVIKGSGHFTPPGTITVVLSLAKNHQVSKLEFITDDKEEEKETSLPSSSCFLKLREGEAALFTVPRFSRIKLAAPTTLAIFSL